MAKTTAVYDRLLHRAGELMAHFGRYDMYALLLERTLLSSHIGPAQRAPRNLFNRGKSIQRLMENRKLSAKSRVEFGEINAGLNAILERNQIAARNPAVLADSAPDPCHDTYKATFAKDWYDCAESSLGEIVSATEAMEREIVKLIGLYMRLAALVHAVRGALRRLN